MLGTVLGLGMARVQVGLDKVVLGLLDQSMQEVVALAQFVEDRILVPDTHLEMALQVELDQLAEAHIQVLGNPLAAVPVLEVVHIHGHLADRQSLEAEPVSYCHLLPLEQIRCLIQVCIHMNYLKSCKYSNEPTGMTFIPKFVPNLINFLCNINFYFIPL